MKKKVLFGLSLFSMVLMSCGGEESTEETTDETTEEVVEEVAGPVEYTIDVENTSVAWIGYELNEEEGVHQAGTVKASSGSVTVEGDLITNASMMIDMNSIMSDMGSEKLDGHLKNEDFFDVNNFASVEFSFDRHEEGVVYGSISVLGTDMAVEAPAELITDETGLTINVSEFRLDMSNLPFFIADLEMPAEEQHNPSVGFTATIKGTK